MELPSQLVSGLAPFFSLSFRHEPYVERPTDYFAGNIQSVTQVQLTPGTGSLLGLGAAVCTFLGTQGGVFSTTSLLPGATVQIGGQQGIRSVTCGNVAI